MFHVKRRAASQPSRASRLRRCGQRETPAAAATRVRGGCGTGPRAPTWVPVFARSTQTGGTSSGNRRRLARPSNMPGVERHRERQAMRGSLRAVASTAGSRTAREVEYCQRSSCETGRPRIPARMTSEIAVSERALRSAINNARGQRAWTHAAPRRSGESARLDLAGLGLRWPGLSARAWVLGTPSST